MVLLNLNDVCRRRRIFNRFLIFSPYSICLLKWHSEGAFSRLTGEGTSESESSRTVLMQACEI